MSIMNRKRRKTVRAGKGIGHSIVVYSDLWDAFDNLRKNKKISTRSESFRRLMKRAVEEDKI